MAEHKAPAYPKDGLWFDNEADRKAFDEHMRSLVTIESDDIEDDNFALKLFSPEKLQEKFWEPSQRYAEEAERLIAELRDNGNLDHDMPRPNLPSTGFRDGHILRKFGFWTTAYLILRELPIRNFYARATIMWIAYWQYKNHNIRRHEAVHNLLAKDDYHTRRLLCFPKMYRQVNFKVQSNHVPTVEEGLVWGVAHKPAIGKLWSVTGMMRYLGGSLKREVQWDGTMNMPLHRSYGFGSPVMSNFIKNP